MDMISAGDAKTNFGALLDQAQQGPIRISKYGRPVAVLMSVSEFEEHQKGKLRILQQEIRKGTDSLKKDRCCKRQQDLCRSRQGTWRVTAG